MNVEKQIREILTNVVRYSNMDIDRDLVISEKEIRELITSFNHIFAINIPKNHPYFDDRIICISGLIKLVEEAMAAKKRDYKKLFEKMVEEITCPYLYKAMFESEHICNPKTEYIYDNLGCKDCMSPDKIKEKECWEKYLEGNNE